jgi:polysaccharide export outer membrane protein
LSGSVNQPGIYELNGETTIAQALAAAGGLTSLAGSARALLERIDDRSTRRVDQFSLDRAGLNRTLKDGDLLRIFPVSPKFENAVLLQGNVAEPGRYEWKEGMRVSDLIPSRVALVTRAYWQQHNRTPDEAGGREKPAISTRTRLAGAQNAAERPEDGTGDRPDAAEEPTALERIADLNAEINWEYAVIERLDEHDLSTRLISFRLGNAIDEPESVDNQLLKAGDIVTIFSRADLPLPMEKHATFVSVNGEVNAPGLYRVAPGETLRDVVARAGGLTPHSYLYASLLTRISVRHAQQEELRQAAEKMQRELVSHYASSMPQNGQSTGDQQSQLSLQQAAIGRLAAVPVSGRVVLDMKPEAGTLDDIPAVALEDGDSFFIPPRLSTVQVTGAVYNANAFRQETGKRLIAYLNDAGGATRDADRKHIYVLRADGTVVNAESGERHRHGGLDAMLLLPGDAIVVPEKLAGSSKLNTFMQAAQFASQTAVTAAALSVIR